MKKSICFFLVFILLFSLIPISLNPIISAENNGDWVIDGNTVYVNDTRCYASASPHTLYGRGWVTFEFESKQYSGNVDFIWGFNHTNAKPRYPLIWKNYTHYYTGYHWVERWGCKTFNDVTNYTSLGIDNYSNYSVDFGNSNNSKLYSFEFNNTVFIAAFTEVTQVGDGDDYRICGHYDKYEKYIYTQSFYDWKPLNLNIEVHNWNYQDMTRWYLLKNQPITSGVRYKIRTWIDAPFNSNGKYWWAFKPSAESLSEAIGNNHLYALDPWYDNNWNYKKLITLNSSQVNTDLGNFPVLVYLSSDVDLAARAQSDGDDIIFVDSTETTQFNHEIEYYDNSTGELIAWVNVTKLLGGSDTTIYMYYNNTGCSNQEDPGGVWSNGYVMVQHMNDSTTSTIVGSTSNHFQGTKNETDGESLNGQIGRCQYFEQGGGYDYIDISDNDNLSFGDGTSDDNLTISMWVRFDSFPQINNIIISKSADNTEQREWLVHYRNQVGGYRWQLSLYDDSGGADDYSYLQIWNSTQASVDTWYYAVFTYNGGGTTDDISVYIDGVKGGTSNTTFGSYEAMQNTSTDVRMGWNVAEDNEPLHGLLEEVRISNVERNASWIGTEYNNQYNYSDGGFYTLGSQSFNGTLDSPYGFNSTPLSNGSMFLNWTNDADAARTIIVRNESGYTGYPSSVSNGTEVYNGTGVNYTDTGVGCGFTYRYAAWHYLGGHFSSNQSNVSNCTIPQNPYGLGNSISGSNINISWNIGNGSDSTMLRRKIGNYPSNISDGTLLCNDTNSSNISSITADAFYRLWSYNSTLNMYSTGYNYSYGGLQINVYNESNNSESVNFTVIISNQAGTQTYQDTNCVNTHTIDTALCPKGDDTIIIINATGYKDRIYYMDIAGSIWYTLNAFLPPIFTSTDEGGGDSGSNKTYTKLYYLTVTDKYDDPIDDVAVEIARFINTTSSYSTVASGITDGYGQCSFHLISNALYRVTLTKEYYTQVGSKFWIPDPSYYGIYYPKIFIMEFNETELTNASLSDEIRFNASIYNNNTIYIQYNDIELGTTNAQFIIYEEYNFSITYMNGTSTTSNTFTAWLGISNYSRMHRIVIRLNHSTLGSNRYYSVTINPYQDTKYNTSDIESKFDSVFGNWDIPYVDFFLIFIPVIILLIVFGPGHAGLGVIASGLYIGFSSLFISVPSAVFGLAPLIIAFGFILIFVKKKRGDII